MFTGLVTELGKVVDIKRGESSAIFTISAPASTSELSVGDSIAVNGVCLTATTITDGSFTADVMVQTLNLTSLSQVEVGTSVKLFQLAAALDICTFKLSVDEIATLPLFFIRIFSVDSISALPNLVVNIKSPIS